MVNELLGPVRWTPATHARPAGGRPAWEPTILGLDKRIVLRWANLSQPRAPKRDGQNVAARMHAFLAAAGVGAHHSEPVDKRKVPRWASQKSAISTKESNSFPSSAW